MGTVVTEPRAGRSFDRFLRRWRRAPAAPVAPDLPARDLDWMATGVEKALSVTEPTAQREAVAEVLHGYAGLDEIGRRRFLEMLAERFSADPAALDRAAQQLQEATDPVGRVNAQRAMRRALRPRYATFLRALTGLPDGVKLLVDLRAELLSVRGSHPVLGMLDDDLVTDLRTLFDVGVLELRRITWQDTPAAVLEKLIAYEAVHEIKGWDDLKDRLDSDRRCFGFFHPAMPDEPLVFVEIALTTGIAAHLPALLDQQASALDPAAADTAIFYSITNCQPGLAGVNLGNELIKRVVDELRRDRPNLQTFATLSPIPTLRAYVEATVDADDLSEADRDAFSGRVVEADDPDYETWASKARPGILSLTARHLTTSQNGRVQDPVGNFHLSNGASVERVNWAANPARYGLEDSFGVMVNYRYDTDSIAANVAAYTAGGRVAASKEVRALIR
jgi:malonyl-CoA decarboxylase